MIARAHLHYFTADEVNNNNNSFDKAHTDRVAVVSAQPPPQDASTLHPLIQSSSHYTVSSTSIPFMDDTTQSSVHISVDDAACCDERESSTSSDSGNAEPAEDPPASAKLTIKPANPACGFSFDDILKANLDYLSSDDDLDVDLDRSPPARHVIAPPSAASSSSSSSVRKPTTTTSSTSKSCASPELLSTQTDIDVTSSARLWDEKLSRVARDKVSEQRAELDDSALMNIQKTKLKWEELAAQQNNGSATGSDAQSRDENEHHQHTDGSSSGGGGGKKLSQKLLDATFKRALASESCPVARKLSIEGMLDQPDIKQAAESWERRAAEESNSSATERQPTPRRVRLVSKSAEEIESDIMSLDVSAESIANVSSTKSRWEHLLRDDVTEKNNKKTSARKSSTLRKATDFGSLRGKFELRNPNAAAGQDSSDC